MSRLILLLLLASQCYAQMWWTSEKSTGLVVYVTTISAPTTSLTTCEQCIAPNPGFEYDDYGRCRFQMILGRPVPLAKPRWPADASLKALRTKPIMMKMEQACSRMALLQAWQNDASLVALRDRSAELASAQSRLAELKSIYTGP